ncbi:MAG TPA: porin family protein [Candidatus Kapabacteria bacterium]|nr:porin family protein [Candidatus Kapabacteria bacterium]
MKIKIAISTSFLLLFTVTGTLRAQYATSWWGLRAGVSLASESITVPDNATVGIKPGVLGGLAYEHWFDDTWGLNASLLYDQKGVSEVYATSAGARVKNNGAGPGIYSGNDDFTLSYLEIPVVIKFSFGEGDIRPYVAAGPSFGLLLGGSESPTGDLAPVTDLKSYLQPINVSFYGGLGLSDELYHGPMITFDAGYAGGLTKIYKSNPPGATITNSDGSVTYTNPRMATDGQVFPHPIDPTNAKSSDILITVGIMWRM